EIPLVEDDDMLRRTITLALARRGHSIAEADSVTAAQEMLAMASRPFDVILLDINLPDRTGWDLLRELPQIVTRTTGGGPGTASATPAVIVTTAVHPLQCRLDEFHPTGFLVKPFPIDALTRLINRVLTSRGSAPEQHNGQTPAPMMRPA